MIKKTMARIGAVLALAALLTTGVIPAAQAAERAPATVSVSSAVSAGAPTSLIPGAPNPTPSQGFSVCQTSSQAANSKNLPVNRWQGATNELHSRMEGGINVGSFMGTIHRDFVVGSGMSFGNFLWSQGANLAEFSIGFCMLNKMGGAADGIGKTIGEVMIFGAGAPILVLLVVAGLITVLLQGLKGSINWKSLFQKALVVGLLAFMTIGSMNSRGGGINGSTADYTPGVGSPGWVVTTINNTVASLASAPAMALAVEQPDSGGRSGGHMSCKNYVSGLNTKYMETFGSGTNSLAAGVPLVISSMWERSGLTAWRAAQFGAGTEADKLSDRAWCRMLEWNAGTGEYIVKDALKRADPTLQNLPGETAIRGSKAFFPMTVEQKDRSVIAWSACKLNTKTGNVGNEESWTVDNSFNALKDKNITSKDCADWFSKDSADLKQFDWPTKVTGIAERAGDQDSIKNFVETLHGNQNGDGAIASIAFVISSLVAFGVFGLISLGILVAKIVQVMMIITLFVTGIGILTPRGSMEKLGRAMKSLIGVTVFIFGIQLVFAFLSQITNMIQKTGSTLLSGDTTWLTLWTGLSPAIAVFVMHLVFTKILKVPSPFKISGGLAWAGAAGAGGAAAMGGISRMLDRPGSKMARGAMSAGRRTMNGALGKVSGGRLGGATGNGSTGRSQSGEVKPAKTGGKGVDTRSALEAAKATTASTGAAVAGSGAAAESRDQAGGAKVDTEVDTNVGADGSVETTVKTAVETNVEASAAQPSQEQFHAQAAEEFAPVSKAEQKANKRRVEMQRQVERKGERDRAREARKAQNRAADQAASGADGNWASNPIDPTVLANSGIANSALTKGKMTRVERKQYTKAQNEELAAAKEHAKKVQEELGVAGKPGTLRGKAANSIHNAITGAREDKVGAAKKIAKGAVIGAGVVAATAVVPWAVPAAAGYYATKGGVRVAQKNTKAVRNAKNDNMVNMYRQRVLLDHAQRQQQQRAAEAAAAKAAKKNGKGGKNGKGNKGQGSNGQPAANKVTGQTAGSSAGRVSGTDRRPRP